jgi:hypothetical protein
LKPHLTRLESGLRAIHAGGLYVGKLAADVATPTVKGKRPVNEFAGRSIPKRETQRRKADQM